MVSQQPSPPPTYSTTTPSKSLNQKNKLWCKPLQENQPISPFTTNDLLTITFLALITILSILHLIQQSIADLFDISNISLLLTILSIASIASITAPLWRKYKSWRVRRRILDAEEAVGLMDEDETLEEGGELYAVGWEDGSRDSKEGDGGDLGR